MGGVYVSACVCVYVCGGGEGGRICECVCVFECIHVCHTLQIRILMYA